MQLELHPYNDGFNWEDRKGPFQIITEDQARQYNENGFFVLEDAFDAETIREVTEALDPLEAKMEELLQGMEGGKFDIAQAGQITFTIHCVTRSEVAKRFSAHPVFAKLCNDLMGPDCRLYWDQAVYKKPEPGREFPWHQDNGYTFVKPQQYLTCWVALTDATVENGCPWVVPNVHRQGTFKHWKTDLGWKCVEDDEGTAMAAPVKAGSIVVFSSLSPHRTGPNETDSVRKSYILQYAPDGNVMMNPDGTPGAECNDETRQYFVTQNGEPSIANWA